MSKFCSTPVFDAALTKISTATQMVATSGQPATYAAATSGALSQATMAPTDFAIVTGDTAGSRKVTVAAKSGLSVIAAGTVDHVSLLDPVTTTLLYVTTCPAQAIVAGGTVSLAGWQVEIDQPV